VSDDTDPESVSPWSENAVRTSRNGFWYNVFDVLFNVVIIVSIVAVIRTFIVSPFEVEGNSMLPTLEDNQYIVINKFGYRLGDPERGDVVVFHPPGDPKKYYVKRIIGIPGDSIIIKDGLVHVSVNGKEVALPEPYLDDRNSGRTFNAPVGSGDRSETVYKVPVGGYFLLGDNRMGSLDSRSFRSTESSEPMPFVQRSSITGRVWFVALPIKKSHALQTPDYDVAEQ
jgi:signal peptidase I